MLFLSILLGCPLPPSESTNEIPPNTTQRPNNGGNPANGSANGTMAKPPGAPPAVGSEPSSGGPAGKPGGVLMDMEQMKAQQAQSQIESLDHVTISGRINGDCDGILRLDVIGTEDLGGPQDGGEMKGPITTKVLETTGEFSIVIPRGSSVNLAALCDGDGNNKITSDADQLSLGARLGIVDDDVGDITLTLEAIKPPSGDLPAQKPLEE